MAYGRGHVGVVVLGYKMQRHLGAVIEQHFSVHPSCPHHPTTTLLRRIITTPISPPGGLPEAKASSPEGTFATTVSLSEHLIMFTTLPTGRYVLMKLVVLTGAD